MQVYKWQQGLGSWAQFTQAVREKFGFEEFPQAMRGMLHLTQKAGLDDYIKAFHKARYANSMHNPNLGETFFVSQFIKGLKGELQGYVMAQLPWPVDCAILLAQIQ